MEGNLSLKEFIKETLIDVCEAIEEAREEFSYIAPKIDDNPQNTKATLIEFDVAVTVGDSIEESSSVEGKLKGKAGINVLKAEANVEGSITAASENTTSKVSRIKFNVPVHFRFDEEENRRRLARQQETRRKVEKHNQRGKSSTSWMGG